MSAKGELFVTEELTEMASKAGLLNLEIEELIVPENYYDIWREEDIPSEGIIDIIKHYEDDYKPEENNFEDGVKVDEIKFLVEHFVDDWGYGKFINHYVKSIERNGIKKMFEKDSYLV